jgi:transcriptional regulator with XRE-family HTH domain
VPVSDFAELLRHYRTARSLTQEELATRARITQKAVGALERGERRRPYPHTVRALAEALGLDDDERARLVAAVPPSGRGPRPDVPAAVLEPTNEWLPAPAGPVIGRDDQVESIAGALRDPSRLVVTLTGPGGVGKTTLALLVAVAARERFPAGTALVELADVRGEPADRVGGGGDRGDRRHDDARQVDAPGCAVQFRVADTQPGGELERPDEQRQGPWDRVDEQGYEVRDGIRAERERAGQQGRYGDQCDDGCRDGQRGPRQPRSAQRWWLRRQGILFGSGELGPRRPGHRSPLTSAPAAHSLGR